jgi:phosphohistidine phosphatase
MSIVVLMRHAAAENAAGVRDFERPLSRRGSTDARGIGRWLARMLPDLGGVACSSALRARETAGLVLAAYEPPPAMTLYDALYLADPPLLLDALGGLPHRPWLIVGHNPGLEEVLQQLVSRAAPGPHGLSPGALFVLQFAGAADRARRGAATVLHSMDPARLPAEFV